MLRASMERDPSYDGLFFTGVTTTMIFCRPSCKARKPKPEHVEFYATARKALFAGFRPCLRCRPLEDRQHTPAWISRLIDQVEADPSRRIRDAELREQQIDPVAARRYFQKRFGMTFQAYSRARRLGRAFSDIRRGGSIDDAVFEHGWESHSGFRRAFAKAAKAPPGAIAGGAYVRLAWLDTPLGPMVAGATEEAICLLEFTDRRMIEAQLKTVESRFRLPLIPGDSPLFGRLGVALQEYYAGKRKSFDLPLRFPGTVFQRRVWNALLRIPYGQTRYYKDIARDLGMPRGTRAVGRANGLNRISILIPCHRVIQSDGRPGGYGGGLWRKLRLLETEGSQPFSCAGNA